MEKMNRRNVIQTIAAVPVAATLPGGIGAPPDGGTAPTGPAHGTIFLDNHRYVLRVYSVDELIAESYTGTVTVPRWVERTEPKIS